MSERDERQVPAERRDDPSDAAVAHARGEEEEEKEATLPGGDVRTIYSEDRTPGEAEPDEQPS